MKITIIFMGIRSKYTWHNSKLSLYSIRNLGQVHIVLEYLAKYHTQYANLIDFQITLHIHKMIIIFLKGPWGIDEAGSCWSQDKSQDHQETVTSCYCCYHCYCKHLINLIFFSPLDLLPQPPDRVRGGGNGGTLFQHRCTNLNRSGQDQYCSVKSKTRQN